METRKEIILLFTLFKLKLVVVVEFPNLLKGMGQQKYGAVIKVVGC